MGEAAGPVPKRDTQTLIWVLLAIAAIVVLRSAWIGDDAWISFRTVDNFVNGYGLTWNVAERVQSFSNPLWVLLVSLFYLMTGEIYYTTTALSLVLSVATLWLLASKVSLSGRAAIVSITILVCSKTFIDYSASGLENPLTHFLLVSFAAVFFSQMPARRKLFWLSIIAALGMTNRMDTALIYLPPLAYTFYKNRGWQNLRRVLLGFSPFLAWESFSIIYYGFPFPNTYYAKLHTGIPFGEILEQGMLYFVDSLSIDPLALLVIVVSLTLVLALRKWDQLPLTIGVVLYLSYIVYIGGDFMSGRFFAAPLVIAVVLISKHDFESKKLPVWVAIGIVLLMTLVNPRSPLLTGRAYGTSGETGWSSSGIADERAHYYQRGGLLGLARLSVEAGSEHSSSADPGTVSAIGSIGKIGFDEGPELFWVDENGLADPLLARLPAIRRKDWRVGHYIRRIPIGYLETLKTGEDRLHDSLLAEYYGALTSITRGPIWSWDRFSNIIGMNFGQFDYLLDHVGSVGVITVTYSEISGVKPQGTNWNSDGSFVLDEAGMIVKLDSVCHHEMLEISVDHNDTYRLSFRLDGLEVHRSAVQGYRTVAGATRSHGLAVFKVDIPSDIAAGGYNEIQVTPSFGDQLYSVGHLVLIEKSGG